jgi:hypothetical protein
MSNDICKAPFCTNKKNNSRRSNFCNFHLHERKKFKVKTYVKYNHFGFSEKHISNLCRIKNCVKPCAFESTLCALHKNLNSTKKDYFMECKVHGLLNECEVRVQLGKIRKDGSRRSSVKVCNHCVRARQSNYRAENVDQETIRRKRNSLRYNFKISIDEFNRMKEEQDNKCLICKNPEVAIHPRKKTIQDLSVDHCHKNGTIRGLLCTQCNNGLGRFKDNIDLLQSAIEYLRPK